MKSPPKQRPGSRDDEVLGMIRRNVRPQRTSASIPTVRDCVARQHSRGLEVSGHQDMNRFVKRTPTRVLSPVTSPQLLEAKRRQMEQKERTILSSSVNESNATTAAMEALERRLSMSMTRKQSIHQRSVHRTGSVRAPLFHIDGVDVTEDESELDMSVSISTLPKVEDTSTALKKLCGADCAKKFTHALKNESQMHLMSVIADLTKSLTTERRNRQRLQVKLSKVSSTSGSGSGSGSAVITRHGSLAGGSMSPGRRTSEASSAETGILDDDDIEDDVIDPEVLQQRDEKIAELEQQVDGLQTDKGILDGKLAAAVEEGHRIAKVSMDLIQKTFENLKLFKDILTGHYKPVHHHHPVDALAFQVDKWFSYADSFVNNNSSRLERNGITSEDMISLTQQIAEEKERVVMSAITDMMKTQMYLQEVQRISEEMRERAPYEEGLVVDVAIQAEEADIAATKSKLVRQRNIVLRAAASLPTLSSTRPSTSSSGSRPDTPHTVSGPVSRVYEGPPELVTQVIDAVTYSLANVFEIRMGYQRPLSDILQEPDVAGSVSPQSIAELGPWERQVSRMLEMWTLAHDWFQGIGLNKHTSFLMLVREAAPHLVSSPGMDATIQRSMEGFNSYFSTILNYNPHRMQELSTALSKVVKSQGTRAKINWKGLVELDTLMQAKQVVSDALRDSSNSEVLLRHYQQRLDRFEVLWNMKRKQYRLAANACWSDFLNILRTSDAALKKHGIDVDALAVCGPRLAHICSAIEKKVRLDAGRKVDFDINFSVDWNDREFVKKARERFLHQKYSLIPAKKQIAELSSKISFPEGYMSTAKMDADLFGPAAASEASSYFGRGRSATPANTIQRLMGPLSQSVKSSQNYSNGILSTKVMHLGAGLAGASRVSSAGQSISPFKRPASSGSLPRLDHD